ncbi:hypothetical protein GCM10009864_20210 [Streptomyces lunalinharesii]|uniref:Uncharacterized protein n=1 Tax=Streptomyces lunalinharesii TaxID=333384 RepID=A0ABN3RKN8_9ACTN
MRSSVEALADKGLFLSGRLWAGRVGRLREAGGHCRERSCVRSVRRVRRPASAVNPPRYHGQSGSRADSDATSPDVSSRS